GGAAVAGDGGMAAVADPLGRLVDKNMVAVSRRSAGGHRWRLLETVRAYALDQLAGSDEGDDVHMRHTRWAATTAQALENRLGDGASTEDDSWRDDFDLVVDDLRAAADRPDPAAVQVGRALAHL